MRVITKSKHFSNASIFLVETGTTGLRGGDSGHGGRTYLRLRDESGGDFRIRVAAREVLMEFGGDAELENLIDGLEFALDVLRQSKDGGTQADDASANFRTVE